MFASGGQTHPLISVSGAWWLPYLALPPCCPHLGAQLGAASGLELTLKRPSPTGECWSSKGKNFPSSSAQIPPGRRKLLHWATFRGKLTYISYFSFKKRMVVCFLKSKYASFCDYFNPLSPPFRSLWIKDYIVLVCPSTWPDFPPNEWSPCQLDPLFRCRC